MTNTEELAFLEKYRQRLENPERRHVKAAKALAVLRDHLGDLATLSALDVGCAIGEMTHFYGGAFASIVGIDADRLAVRHAAKAGLSPARYVVADAQDLPFRSASTDVVICAHVYEHLPNPDRLLAEIHRVLRPGGVCFFAAANRLKVVEPHHGLPFLSWLPKPAAHWYLRLIGRGQRYEETHLTYWSLKRLVRRFELVDYTRRIIEDPARFSAVDMLRPGSLGQRGSALLTRVAPWVTPTYVWLLVKPG